MTLFKWMRAVYDEYGDPVDFFFEGEQRIAANYAEDERVGEWTHGGIWWIAPAAGGKDREGNATGG